MNVIYRIRNIANNKFYVGSTVNQKVRFQDHRRMLRRGKHHCKHLQASWDKYGEEFFKFEVVETVPDDVDLAAVETRWLDAHHGKAYCYNTGRTAEAPWRGGAKESHPSFGRVKTAEEKVAISESLREYYAADPTNHPRLGKKHTDEAKAKMAQKVVHRGESHYRYGKTLSEEIRKKIGDAQRGVKKGPRILTEEGKARIRAAADAGHYGHWKGKTHTEESKAKMSKRVVEITTGQEFVSLSAALAHYGLKMPTLRRALLSGMPIARGPHKGLVFQYLTPHENPATVAAP